MPVLLLVVAVHCMGVLGVACTSGWMLMVHHLTMEMLPDHSSHVCACLFEELGQDVVALTWFILLTSVYVTGNQCEGQ